MSARNEASQSPWPLLVASARYAAGIGSAHSVAEVARRYSDLRHAARTTREHGLGGLLARALVESGNASLLTTFDETSGAFSSDSARSLAMVRLLAMVYGALLRAGVPALPYKGPLLSLQLYGDIAMRHSVDLDLVVPRESYPMARRALVELGLPPRGGHSERQERTIFRWLGQASFGTDDDQFVELHWRFAPAQLPFSLTPAVALSRASHIAVAGHDFPTLSPEDLVVTLAMHGLRHLYERLEWLSGVTRLMRSFPESETLLEHAARLHVRRMLLVSVGLSESILGATLTESWRRALDVDGRSRALVTELTPAIIAAAADDRHALRGFAMQRLLPRMLDSRLDGARSIARGALLPTEREWEMIRLPDPLSPLYHVVRPIRLLGMYARRAVRRTPALLDP